MISLIVNNGYKWIEKKGIHFKGYFIDINRNDGIVYRNEVACERLGEIKNFIEFVDLLKDIQGSFSIVIEKGESIWLAVDIARSMPLFYSENYQFVSDSAESIRNSLGIRKEEVNKDFIVELYANYYLFGHKTVYSEVKQLDLGEVVELTDKGINVIRYFEHLNEINNTDVHELRQIIETAANNAYERIKAVIGNRPVVLSMSGGYDSRFVGCMLKKAGIEDVSCYTYGKESSFEVIQSRKNAEALGYRWKCVEMTDELVSRNLDKVGQAYFDSYSGHDFTAYMQNFTAVRKLEEEGWFKPDSVFLTGLCGDMPTGEYVLPFDAKKEYSLDTAANTLYNKIFTRYNLEERHKEMWLEEVKTRLKELPIDIHDYHSWQQAIDCVYTSSCHVHWYMHMNSVHSFFGYEWLLPYWDKELLLAWYSVPSEHKVKQKMYEDWLMEVVCKPYGLSQRKTIVVYSDKKVIRKIQYVVGGVFNYLLLHLGIPFKRKQDYNNFAPFELALFKKINARDCINYRRSGMMQLLEDYLIEKRYGEENLRYACSKVKSKQ